MIMIVKTSKIIIIHYLIPNIQY